MDTVVHPQHGIDLTELGDLYNRDPRDLMRWPGIDERVAFQFEVWGLPTAPIFRQVYCEDDGRIHVYLDPRFDHIVPCWIRPVTYRAWARLRRLWGDDDGADTCEDIADLKNEEPIDDWAND